MKIDDTLLTAYFEDKKKAKNHWVFQEIVSGELLFDDAVSWTKEDIADVVSEIETEIKKQPLLNQKIIEALFPNWTEMMDNVQVVLSLGVPAPYDAMIRVHDDKEYMIYDIGLLLRASNGDKNQLIFLMRKLFTHEFVHLCIHDCYPNTVQDYKEKLQYICFDEGFAHYLSYVEGVGSADFTELETRYYSDAYEKLRTALHAERQEEQMVFLEQANTGKYWDKYAATVGQIYLGLHKDKLEELLEKGPNHFLLDFFE